jgi:hypothetical protein
MQPLQVWLPTFEGSINLPRVNRDARRAFNYWKDEVAIWLIPELTQPVRWKHEALRCLAIPAEHLDRIDIAHIDAEGRIYAPTAAWLPKAVDGLLDEWLNVGEVQLTLTPKELNFPVPVFDSDPPRWEVRKVTFAPGPLIPISGFNADHNVVSLVWPPKGFPMPISAEAESAEKFPLKIADDCPDEAVSPEGERSLRVWLKWPEPFNGLMPMLGGVDHWEARNAMTVLARCANKDRSTALMKGAAQAAPWFFPGESTLELSWLRPAQLAGMLHVMLLAEDRGLNIPQALRNETKDAALLEKLIQTEDWQRFLAHRVPIQRVWGPVGLLWWLLLDEIKQQASFVLCENCGKLIRGKRGKRFCSEKDGRTCIRQRRAGYKRRSRDKGRS